MAGLTAQGLEIATQEEISDEIKTEMRDAWGDSIKVSSRDPLGQLADIVAERFALLWQLVEAIFSSTDPDKATDTALDAICALTGTVRDPATFSTAEPRLTGTPTTVVPAGSQMSVDSTGKVFATDANATIVAVPAWASTTAYVVGDRVYNTAVNRVYECVVAGTSGGLAPIGTSKTLELTDGTVEWRFLGTGTGAVTAPSTAVETGPTIALSGTLIVIDTPVSGWEDLNNIDDATLGSDTETDSALRVRREDELASAGTSPIDPLRAALLDVDNVTQVTLFVNNTDDPVDFGGTDVPPHAVEALVIGGADQDIWDALGENVAAGIETAGTEVGTFTDSEGNTHTMKFSRPTSVQVHVDIAFTYDASVYPADGDTQVKAAIVAWGQTLVTGQDVHDSATAYRAFGVPGLIDVTSAKVDTVDPPTTASVPISIRQIATINSADIDVTSTPGTP